MGLTHQGEMIKKEVLSMAACLGHHNQRTLVDSTSLGRAAFSEIVCSGV